MTKQQHAQLAAMKAARNLYEQTTAGDRDTIAQLLGFGHGNGAGEQVGFTVNLRDIAPLPAGWTYGDATRAYCKHLLEYWSTI